MKGIITAPGGEEVHTLYTHAQKYSPKSLVSLPIIIHARAVDFFFKRMGDVSAEKRTPLTDWEAINGVDEMIPINMKTAGGFTSQFITKKDLFEKEPGQIRLYDTYRYTELARTKVIPVYGETFVQHLTTLEHQIGRGKALECYWVSTNKDELVKSEKAVIGKTRVFEQSSIETTILIRKYFGHFLNYYKRNAGFRFHHTIGCDNQAIWKDCWEELQSMGTRGFDLDYKNYDGTVCEGAKDFFLAITDYYYGTEGKEQRHALVHHISNAMCIVGDYVTTTVQGNKSGCAMTDVFNSITNTWLIYGTYMMSRKAAGLDPVLDRFDADVRLLTYGDDVIIAATDKCLEYFNRSISIDIGKWLGYDITPANKGTEIAKDDDLRDLTFLKCPFVERDGVVMAPLPKPVIWRELIWERKANTDDDIVLSMRIDCALRAMCMHGREAANQLISNLSENGIKVRFDYDDWLLILAEKQRTGRVDRLTKREQPIDTAQFVLRSEKNYVLINASYQMDPGLTPDHAPIPQYMTNQSSKYNNDDHLLPDHEYDRWRREDGLIYKDGKRWYKYVWWCYNAGWYKCTPDTCNHERPYGDDSDYWCW